MKCSLILISVYLVLTLTLYEEFLKLNKKKNSLIANFYITNSKGQVDFYLYFLIKLKLYKDKEVNNLTNVNLMYII